MAALSKNSAVRLLNGNIQIDTPLKHAARAYEEATGKHVEIESLGGGVDQQAALKQYYQAGPDGQRIMVQEAGCVSPFRSCTVTANDPFAAPVSGFAAVGKTSAWHWMGQPSNLAQDYTGSIFQNFASGVINTEQFVQNMKNAVSAGIASWRA